MYEEKYKPLTQDEINSLDFEMRICFYIYPWNHWYNPKSVDDWIEMFHPTITVDYEFLNAVGDSVSDAQKKVMMDEFNSYSNLISELKNEGRI